MKSFFKPSTIYWVVLANPSVYETLARTTQYIVDGLKKDFKSFGKDYTINCLGSMFTIFFTEEEVYDLETAKKSDTALFGKYFNEMLQAGVYLAPSQFESLFISAAITNTIADEIIKTSKQSLQKLLK